MKKLLLFLILIIPNLLFAQSTESVIASGAANYITKYKELAMQEQIRVGMPAAVILAQGIYESESGKSMLALEGNNHFGIKCKKDWKGETILHDDDAKQECFRKYESATQSYLDHSNYLKNNNRYAFLFDLNMLDYKGWAVGLRKAGYATNPAYSTILTALIEKYNLQVFTKSALQKTTNSVVDKDSLEMVKKMKEFDELKVKELEKYKAKEEAKKIAKAKDEAKKAEKIKTKKKNEDVRLLETKVEEVVPEEDKKIKIPIKIKIEQQNNLKGFKAKKGDELSVYAEELNINYKKLLQINDLKDEPLPENLFIYTEKKPKIGLRKSHILQATETLIAVAQKEGIQLGSLRWLNMLYKNDMPVVGTRLMLQEQVAIAPDLVGENKIKPEEESTIITTKPEVINNRTEEPTTIINSEEMAKQQAEMIANTPSISEIIKNNIDEEKKQKEPIKIYPKSPSTYNEPELSNEIKKLKKQMDVMVYAIPPTPKPKKNIVADSTKPNTIIAPKTVIKKQEITIKTDKTKSPLANKPSVKKEVQVKTTKITEKPKVKEENN